MTFIDTKALFAALEARIDALRGTTPVAWENKAFTPKVGIPYIRVNRIPAPTQLPSIGGRHARERGYIQVTPTFAVGGGSGAMDAMADIYRNGFSPGDVYTSGAVKVEITGWPSIAPAITQGAWIGRPVSILYKADLLE